MARNVEENQGIVMSPQEKTFKAFAPFIMADSG